MKITDKVIMLDCSKTSHCFLVFDEELCLIDTGMPVIRRQLFRELAALGVNLSDIKHILLTHHDTDHVGNVLALQQASGAQVWAHQEDIPYITGNISRPGKKKYIAKIFGVKPVTNIHPFPDNIQVGNIRILPTPGHTPGHVCMLFDDVLFAGDLLSIKKGEILPYPDNWNADTSMLLQSFASIKDTYFKWLCPSHSQPAKKSSLQF